MTKPTAPAHLGGKARKLWRDISGEYELRADELRVLEDACREVDLVERLEESLRSEPLVVEGSQGQPVASPLVQELRQHRVVLARLLAQLKLPDESGARDTSSAARTAAAARWGRGA